MHESVLKIVQHCEAICEQMTTLLKAKSDIECRKEQLLLLRDCADICTLTAKYIARCSIFAKAIAHLCAHICTTCGNACLKFSDPESQHCGKICLHCARECMAFATMAPCDDRI
ncbi:putative cysteine-rich protein YhjQ [Clostridium polyendosporum]|uniref:Cysteine-rich protein YhjQ n=1 Tax=Clostridium polyendosporum TaxID=69208 RepID=A0A919RZ58_9CLOT|nr:four-helix bundle copper-binding protein [Clostridium polyendosporum]GIM29157.1 putative cysteine-rich protein YhjQ [Clostridium polyendosporum]